jgi:hypothetical protein
MLAACSHAPMGAVPWCVQARSLRRVPFGKPISHEQTFAAVGANLRLRPDKWTGFVAVRVKGGLHPT